MHLPLSSLQPSPDFVAEHVRDIPRSGIRDFFEIVQSMAGVISLGIGEPDFVTPWHIRESAIYALSSAARRAIPPTSACCACARPFRTMSPATTSSPTTRRPKS